MAGRAMRSPEGLPSKEERRRDIFVRST
jgi:hypothetical protein